MIDASILATEMIIRYNPKFLIMVGVLGGKPEKVKIGDVVIATKVFTVDKGKINELGFHKEVEGSSIENAYITKIQRDKKQIERFIEDADNTRNKNIAIHFGPIGCVRQVIDLKDYFKDNIEVVDRKTIALEMESYGITRACELVNNGQTKPLIIKGVMDNTIDKTDGAKSYASFNSVKVLEYIMINGLIK